MKKRTIALLALCLLALTISAQNSYKQERDIKYTKKTDAYAQERLKLDIYYPEGQKDCPVVVWFHGGGLEGGNKEIPRQLRQRGWVVVGVNYRLLPKVTIKETSAIQRTGCHSLQCAQDARSPTLTGYHR